MKIHPCLKCGACCAYFRVSFYWSETLLESHSVPEMLTTKISDYYLAMKGTEKTPSRCQGLTGSIGKRVTCSIYNNRPSPCREFEASYEHNEKNVRCDTARAHWGLKPLEPFD